MAIVNTNGNTQLKQYMKTGNQNIITRNLKAVNKGLFRADALFNIFINAQGTCDKE
ncbi:MAG TPA: hypothetical protein VK553_08680 [Candidatus Nitrosopolaris rasttigaisensis]|nr:hypothetical protein [Candidatus Nitrosopolaris rasttigaisensis]